MSTELLILFITLVIVLYIWQKRAHVYWERLGVVHIKPSPIFGNMRSFLTAKVSFFEQICLLHRTPGFEKEPLVGVYMVNRPGLVVRDLELIKTVMIKKFNYFTNRVLATDPHRDPLGCNNLFFARNPDWKELRNKISPAFTSGKIKQMYPLMTEIAKDLENVLEQVPEDSIVSIKDFCARFTTDLIATIAFGVKANSLGNVKSEFFAHNKAIFETSWSRGLDITIIFLLPALATLARVKVFSKATSKFLRNSISFVLSERERSGVNRNDLIDILLAMKREAAAQPDKNNRALELDYLVAQAAIFQTAGFETSSSTMTMTLFELAWNTELQERLRTEIREYFGSEDYISYAQIQEMPYLTQVVNETLRKYPIVGYAERECNQPANGERFTLQPFYDVELPSGMPVYVSTLAIQRDEQYWPEPEKYDPERFAPEQRDKLNMDAYMPFGVGPRNCIGMRLGLLQTKLGLVHLLRNHRVLKCEKTVPVITFAPFSVVVTPKEQIYLKLQRAGD
ncbi:Cyp6w1 [Drosophila busckii]|uniref:Cyp6w1 n=1 Tax=Drosophila busckii TaxID=30019 RepID=A0A0M3QVM6_DROBS|nr:probable cytochrome P450 6w1 [Drosophila busckii]ALC42669.1 Cyp6w1 [Drosophila busckii]